LRPANAKNPMSRFASIKILKGAPVSGLSMEAGCGLVDWQHTSLPTGRQATDN